MTLRFAAALAGAAVLGTVAAATAACGAGSGPLVTTGSGGREDPGSTRDTPPSTRDGTSADCIECDVQYVCTSRGGTSGGGTNSPTSIDLTSQDGMCTPALIDLVCSGALFGQSSCTGGGGGAFTCGPVTCTPGGAPPLPPGGGASGSGGSGGTLGVDAG